MEVVIFGIMIIFLTIWLIEIVDKKY